VYELFSWGASEGFEVDKEAVYWELDNCVGSIDEKMLFAWRKIW
jgi:hypothetical protein